MGKQVDSVMVGCERGILKTVMPEPVTLIWPLFSVTSNLMRYLFKSLCLTIIFVIFLIKNWREGGERCVFS